jgi:hypothetical protein
VKLTTENRHMTFPGLVSAVMVAISSGALSSGDVGPVEVPFDPVSRVAYRALAVDRFRTLALEQTTTLAVGESAVLQFPADSRYSHSGSDGAWRGVLVRVRRPKQGVVFRAVRPGKGTIIISPKAAGGECVSCATLHYFIEVVSRK